MRLGPAVLLATIGAIACGTGGGTRPTTTTGSRNLLQAEELSRVGDVSLYEALSRLRPTFLRARPAPNTNAELTQVMVVHDNQPMPEGIEYLQRVSARSVQRVQFLEAPQARARFPNYNAAGAILITSKP